MSLSRRPVAVLVLAGWSLGAASGCARLEEQLKVWGVAATPPGIVPGVEQRSPQRFMVLNLAPEDSTLTIETTPEPSPSNPAAATIPSRSRRGVGGQIMINPEDLTRISGVLSAGRDIAFRMRSAAVQGPNSLAGLATPGSLARLLVSGELTSDGETRPAELELLAVADITGGQLNALRVTSARPARFFPTARAESGVRSSSSPDQRVTNVSVELLARPNPSAATVVP